MDRYTERISFRLTDWQAAGLALMAEREGLTPSQVCRQIVAQRVREEVEVRRDG